MGLGEFRGLLPPTGSAPAPITFLQDYDQKSWCLYSRYHATRGVAASGVPVGGYEGNIAVTPVHRHDGGGAMRTVIAMPGNTIPDGEDARVTARISQDAASEITWRLERRGSLSSTSVPIGGRLGGFGLLAVRIGWVKSDVGQVRTEIHVNRGLVETNRDRIDAVNARVGENTERLIRI